MATKAQTDGLPAAGNQRLPAAPDRDFSTLSGRTLLFILLPTVMLMLVFILSYGAFISTSFHELVPGRAMVSPEWTLNSYKRFFSDSLYPAFLWQTIWRSAEITLFAIIIAYPLAYCLVRTRLNLVRYTIMLVLLVPLLAGGISIAYAWIIMLGNVGVVNSGLKFLGLIDRPIKFLYNWRGVVISIVHYLVPFAALSLVGPIQNIPRTLEEAAVNMGASRRQVFTRVLLPLTLTGVIEAGSLTFALALSSFLFPLLLGGGKVKMMSNIIYEKIAVSYDLPFAAVLAMVLLFVSLATVVGLTWVQRLVRRDYA